MNVLFLPKWYPNHTDPLDGIFIREHALAAAKFDQVFVLFVHSHHGLKSRFETRSENQGNLREITVYFRPPRLGLRMADKLLTACFYTIAQWTGWSVIRQGGWRPDVVHVHVFSRTMPFALYLKKRFGIPLLVSEHWTGYSNASGQRIPMLKRKVINFLLRSSDMVTTVSVHLQKAMASSLRFEDTHKFQVLSNTADGTVFSPGPAGKGQEPIVSIVHISTLQDKQKNFSLILETLAEVKDMQIPFRLEVFGTGHELPRHMLYAKTLGLGNHVCFHGLQPKHVIADHLRLAAFLLLFSNYETQSCVAIEALLCGTPVLSSNIGGVDEVIDASNGLLVSHISRAHLVHGIQKMMELLPAFDREEIAKKARCYDHEHIGGRLHGFYTDLLRHR